MKDFDWQVKCDIFIVSMATWTIVNNLEITFAQFAYNSFIRFSYELAHSLLFLIITIWSLFDQINF